MERRLEDTIRDLCFKLINAPDGSVIGSRATLSLGCKTLVKSSDAEKKFFRVGVVPRTPAPFRKRMPVVVHCARTRSGLTFPRGFNDRASSVSGK